MIVNEDCIKHLKTIEDNYFDSVVTDPPYELGFMGKIWDSTGIAFTTELWKEVYRTLKPGGYLLSFSASRNYHRMAVAIEDSGFEIRDQIMWIYGSGFPKSANLGKAIDKKQGNKRIKTGQIKTHARKGVAVAEERTAINAGSFGQEVEEELTVGTSDWEGWGTALKPAHEPIVMARKPLSEKTIAENVLKHGTGGINIDESRVETEDKTQRVNRGVEWGVRNDKSGNEPKVYGSTKGRYPANVIHDGSEEVLEGFPETKGRHGMTQHGSGTNTKYGKFARTEQSFVNDGVGDSGSAARFFYCSKVSKKERNIGQSTDGKNNHPTVKPVALMKYLITLITPKGGKVLDPFNGSGSTGMACVELGYEYTGCELDPDYIEISKVRIEAWYAENKPEEVNEYFDKI